MRREDGDPVAQALQADGGVDDEPFGAADAEVGVDEYDVAFGRGGGWRRWWFGRGDHGGR